MTRTTPFQTPDAEDRPFHLALYWFIEGCLCVAERFLDRFDLFERWALSRNWARYDRIARSCIAFLLCVAGIYVVFLIGYTAWYVTYTPAGAALTGGR